MYEFLVSLTAATIVIGAIYAYQTTKDALHPAIVLAPTLLFVYGVWPFILNSDGGLNRLFTHGELDYVGMLYLVSIVALYIGLVASGKPRERQAIRDRVRNRRDIFSLLLDDRTRKQVRSIAIFLGVIACFLYWYSIYLGGGIYESFNQAKGGGARLGSGYLSESVMLIYPAIVLLAVSRQGLKLRGADMTYALVFASPHLVQGTLGGRRGPLFLALMVLFIAWFIARGRRPTLKTTVIAVALIGASLIVVQSQRAYVYLGSQEQFQAERVTHVIDPTALTSNDYVAGVANVVRVNFFDNFYWGYRYFVTIFIRPIPRQLWPTKYEDVGADWVTQFARPGQSEFFQALGFSPPEGSAVGFISDIYQEFWWGAVIVIYFLGRGYVAMWRRHNLEGGLWTVLFVEMLILSVYIPTQSFAAFYHRLLFMGVITALTWKYYIRRSPQH